MTVHGNINWEKSRFSDQIESLYFNTELRKRHKTFRAILRVECIEDYNNITSSLRSKFEENIQATVDKLAKIQYFMMEQSGDWAGYGQERVIIGYTRLKLCIPPETEVTQADIDTFHSYINREKELKSLSLQDLKKLGDEQAFEILNKKIPVYRSDIINRELRFLESQMRIHSYGSGSYRNIIYGKGKHIEKGGYSVVLYEKELSRTPNNIMAVAALNAERDVAIRRESYRLIFQMKWMQMFKHTPNEKATLYSHEASNISEMIKKLALDAYNVHSAYELKRIEEQFINEIVEGLIWHELGDAFIINEILEKEDAAMINAVYYLGQKNIVSIMRTILADWCPRNNTLKGPIRHFLEISRLDPNKANRMLLVYMSDNWFFDSFEDEFLGSQTNLAIAVLLPFLNNKGQFAFGNLLSKFDTIYRFMLTNCLETVYEVANMLKSCTYRPYKRERTFKFIANSVIRHLNEKGGDALEGSMAYRSTFWRIILNSCNSYAPATYSQIINYLKERKRVIFNKLLELIDKNDSNKYKDKIRDYIFDQMKAKGFFKELKSLDTMDGIDCNTSPSLCLLKKSSQKDISKL